MKHTLLLLLLFIGLLNNAQQPLTNREVYDFEVGDEFGYLDDYYTPQTYGPPNHTQIYVLTRITSRVDSAGSMGDTLSIRYGKSSTYLYNTPTYNYVSQTISDLDSSVAQSFNAIQYSNFYLSGSSCTTLSAKYDDPYSNWKIYAKQLGCVNDYYQYYGPNYYTLVYYKKGNQICGDLPGYSPSAVDDLAAATQVTLAPNPATDNLFIQTNGTPVEQINIYNTTGNLISQTKQPQANTIDISGLATGIYIAEIKTKEGSVKKRWMKM